MTGVVHRAGGETRLYVVSTDRVHLSQEGMTIVLAAGGWWQIDACDRELEEVLAVVAPPLWDALLAAHLEEMKASVRHATELELMLHHSVGDGPVCPECVAEPATHLEELSARVSELARQLAVVSVFTDLRLVTG